MRGLSTVLKKEWRCFLGSGKGVFIMYAVITAIWSVMLLWECADAARGAARRSSGGLGDDMRIWFVFFAVIVGANFSAPTFISERVNGALEVLITSGLARDAVLFGKMVFVIAATAVLGGLCVAMSAVLDYFNLIIDPEIYVLYNDRYVLIHETFVLRAIGANNVFIYLSVAFMNAAASAYFSVRMANPRFLHFINFFMTATILVVCANFGLPRSIEPAVFLTAGILFTLLARREFAGERIIRPVIF